MRTRTMPLLAIGLGLVAALAGCDSGSLSPDSGTIAAEELATLLSSATEDGPVIDTATEDDAAGRRGGTDQRPTRRPGRLVFEQLAEKLPTFGGLYRTDRCAIAVVVTDPSGSERAIGVAKSVVEPLVKRACPNGVRAAVVEGKYTYRQLLRLRYALRPLHQIEGVVGARLDFKRNRVIVGVASREAARQVQSALVRIGVPADAVGVEGVNRRTPQPSA